MGQILGDLGMIEVYGNLWEYPADVRIITTNGTINRKGRAVMGRGCALEAAQRFPELPERLAKLITEGGNRPYLLHDLALLTFPVKHNWWENANVPLIRASALQLLELIDPEKTYVAPRFGCGNGRLDWGLVKSLVRDLPDNVHLITFKEEVAREAK